MIDILSVQTSSVSVNSSAGIATQEQQLNIRYEESASYRPSLQASSLLQRVGGSDLISDAEKNKLFNFIATLDQSGELARGDEEIFGLVSFMILVAEQKGSREGIQGEDVANQQIAEIYNEQRRLLNNDTDKEYELSIRLRFEELAGELFGQPLEQLLTSFEVSNREV